MSVNAAAPSAARSLMDALRAMAATLAEVARVRGSLFSVELREEVERHKRLLVLAAMGAAFLHMALLLATVFVVAAFWDTHRLTAIGAVALFNLACGIAVLRRLRQHREADPPPFSATRSELDRDLAQLRASA